MSIGLAFGPVMLVVLGSAWDLDPSQSVEGWQGHLVAEHLPATTGRVAVTAAALALTVAELLAFWRFDLVPVIAVSISTSALLTAVLWIRASRRLERLATG